MWAPRPVSGAGTHAGFDHDPCHRLRLQIVVPALNTVVISDTKALNETALHSSALYDTRHGEPSLSVPLTSNVALQNSCRKQRGLHRLNLALHVVDNRAAVLDRDAVLAEIARTVPHRATTLGVVSDHFHARAAPG